MARQTDKVVRRRRRRRSGRTSERDLANLGGGELAYIRVLTSEEARRLYPAIEGLPPGISLFALHAADGTPIALTDSRQAALSHAMGDKLEVRSLH